MSSSQQSDTSPSHISISQLSTSPMSSPLVTAHPISTPTSTPPVSTPAITPPILTPPYNSGQYRGVTNPLVAAGLVSPDLILAVPLEDAAVTKRKTKRIIGARDLIAGDYAEMLREDKRRKKKIEEQKQKGGNRRRRKRKPGLKQDGEVGEGVGEGKASKTQQLFRVLNLSPMHCLMLTCLHLGIVPLHQMLVKRVAHDVSGKSLHAFVATVKVRRMMERFVFSVSIMTQKGHQEA